MPVRAWVFIFNKHDTEVSLSILKTFPSRFYWNKLVWPRYCGASSPNIIAIVMKLYEHISVMFRNTMGVRFMQNSYLNPSTNGLCWIETIHIIIRFEESCHKKCSFQCLLCGVKTVKILDYEPFSNKRNTMKLCFKSLNFFLWIPWIPCVIPIKYLRNTYYIGETPGLWKWDLYCVLTGLLSSTKRGKNLLYSIT